MTLYMRLGKCAVVCLFVFVFIAAQANADEPELVNLNPSFEEVPNFNHWSQYINAEAGATFDIDKDAIEGKQCAHIDVVKVSGTNWHVGLTQDGLTVEAGQMYTVDFFAKADAKRIIAIEVKRSPGEGDWEGITSSDITITDEWAEYSHTFTPGKDYKQTAFFGFWLGQVKGEVWIDGVRLYEGKKQEREDLVTPKSVDANGKLITRWAAIKAVH
jgi:hypothetical protein